MSQVPEPPAGLPDLDADAERDTAARGVQAAAAQPAGHTPAGPAPPAGGQQPPPGAGVGWGGQTGGGGAPGSQRTAPTRGFGAEHPTAGVVSLIFGILGLTVLPGIGPLVALVFGFQSRAAVQAEPYRYNDQLGFVGRILGWVGIGIVAAGVLLVVVFMLFFAFIALLGALAS